MSPATLTPSPLNGLSEEEVRAVQAVRNMKKRIPLVDRIRADAPPGSRINSPLKFRLLQGMHVDEDVRTARDRTWVFDDPANNVVETYKQLDSLNTPGYPPKYELIDGGPNARVSPYEPLSGESRDDYSKRLQEMLARQLAEFDDANNSMTLLSAGPAGASGGAQGGDGGKGGVSTAPGKPVDQMTEAELRQLAKDEGVDLSKFRGNRDVLVKHLKTELKV